MRQTNIVKLKKNMKASDQMDHFTRKPTLVKKHNFLLSLLLIMIYVAFIGMQLNRIQAIADYNYSLSEITMAPLTMLMFIGPIILLAYIIVSINLLCSNIKIHFGFKQFAITALIITSFCVITPIWIKQFNEVSTTMIATVEDKMVEQNKYFIVSNNEKINVTHSEYNLIEINQEYLISYRWNKIGNFQSKVTYLEPIVYN